MRENEAQIIALKALEYLATEPELFERFLGMTGMSPTDIANVASETGTLIGVLDFYLGDEALLENFCSAAEISPEAPRQARITLSGEDFY